MVLGKFLGGFFGFLMGIRYGFVIGFFGLLLGAFFGDSFDKGIQKIGRRGSFFSLAENIREIFFEATFLMMGHMAKLDGHVSKDEIKMAEKVMTRFGLTQELRLKAIALFSEGKQANFSWSETIDKLKKNTRRQNQVLQLFIEIQLETAYAEGKLSEEKRSLLLAMVEQLGFSHRDFIRFDLIYQARQRFQERANYYQNTHQQSHQQSHQYNYRSQNSNQKNQSVNLTDLYQILGVESTATDQVVTRAYRQLMSKNHPDKLMSKGLPESMIKLATEKTQQIKAAYDQIMSVRKSKR